jgi:hypothetical protein
MGETILVMSELVQQLVALGIEVRQAAASTGKWQCVHFCVYVCFLGCGGFTDFKGCLRR